MTKQTKGAVVREVRGEYRGRPVIVEVHPGCLIIRAKGTKRRYSADWASVAGWLEMRDAKASAGDIPARK